MPDYKKYVVRQPFVLDPQADYSDTTILSLLKDEVVLSTGANENGWAEVKTSSNKTGYFPFVHLRGPLEDSIVIVDPQESTVHSHELRINVEGKEFSVGASCSLCAVIDVSLSMASPDRIDKVKDTMKQLLKLLGPSHELAIVTFASEAKTEMNLIKMDQDGKNQAYKTIEEKMDIRDGTCYELGIKEAIEVFRMATGDVKRIIFLSDGGNCEGNEDELYLEQLFVKGFKDFTFSVISIAFGPTADFTTLKAISIGPDRGFFHVESVELAVIFKEIFESATRVVYTNLMVHVVAMNGQFVGDNGGAYLKNCEGICCECILSHLSLESQRVQSFPFYIRPINPKNKIEITVTLTYFDVTLNKPVEKKKSHEFGGPKKLGDNEIDMALVARRLYARFPAAIINAKQCISKNNFDGATKVLEAELNCSKHNIKRVPAGCTEHSTFQVMIDRYTKATTVTANNQIYISMFGEEVLEELETKFSKPAPTKYEKFTVSL